MIAVEHRVTEIIVLVTIFDDGERHRYALLQTKALSERPCRNIADNDLKRDNRKFFYNHLAIIRHRDVVVTNAFLCQ